MKTNEEKKNFIPRYEFVYLFDVKNGNPNGDPDLDGAPRVDPIIGIGITTDVMVKRKVRNVVQLMKGGESPYEMFIRQRSVDEKENCLNTTIVGIEGTTPAEKKANACKRFFDVRTFGAVMSTGKEDKAVDTEAGDDADATPKNGKTKKVSTGIGTVRGPVQFDFPYTVRKVFQNDLTITRCCVTKPEDAEKQRETKEFPSTMGRKSTISYGLYRMHGYINAFDAVKTGFSEEDCEILWDALLNAFEHDRAAMRGGVHPRKLIIFKHESAFGNARAAQLFDLVKITSNTDAPGDYSDFTIEISKDTPKGVTLIE